MLTMEVLFWVAPTSASILIYGESGTGKTAPRGRFISTNSSATRRLSPSVIPASAGLPESELFGHVRGSSSGRSGPLGKVKAAEGGTPSRRDRHRRWRFSPNCSGSCRRHDERLGENVTRHANCVHRATNRDLKKRVSEGTFREDLYFRLNVIAVEMPPLRARLEDLIRFAEHYSEHFAAQCGRTIEGFTDEAVACLRAYPWPGNLREMRNAVERAVILAKENRISPQGFPRRCT